MMRLKTFIHPRGNVSGFICFLCFKFYVCLKLSPLHFLYLNTQLCHWSKLRYILFSKSSALFFVLIFSTSHGALENTITFRVWLINTQNICSMYSLMKWERNYFNVSVQIYWLDLDLDLRWVCVWEKASPRERQTSQLLSRWITKFY